MTDSTGSAPQVTTVDAGTKKVARQVVVHAPAATVFDLVADPHQHPELDGSGTVRHVPVTGPARLSQGAKFSVGMKQYGVPYKITSVVTAFEDGRLIEWQHPAGHRWRWEFAEQGPDATLVTETFDYSTAKLGAVLELFKFPTSNGKGITQTLEHLTARFG